MESTVQSKYERALLVRLSSYLVQQNRPFAHSCPPFSLKYIESLLEKSGGMKVKLIDCHIAKHSIEDAVNISSDFHPDLLVIDINFYEFPIALRYLKTVKMRLPSLVVIAIGQDPTVRSADYSEFLDIFNIILPGEPEKEILNLLSELKKGENNIKDLSKEYQIRFQQEGPLAITNLDSLPFPKYNEYEINKYRYLYPLKIKRIVRWGYILSSRGCPHRCIFCSSAIRRTYGKETRLRNAAKVVDEIEYLLRNYKINALCFEDDNFTTNRLHVENICNEILKRKLKIKWVAHARVDEVDYPLLLLMKRAGCDLLKFGVECGSDRIIHLLKKSNKNNWVKQSLSAFYNARRLKISTNALFILGNPTESEEEMMHTINLAKKLKPDLIQIHFFTPYPDSQVYNELKDDLKDIDISKLYHYALPPLALSRIGVKRLKELRSLFYKRMLFSPYFLINHIIKYGPFYAFNSGVFFQLLRIRKYFKNG